MLYGGSAMEVNDLQLLCSCVRCTTPVTVHLTRTKGHHSNSYKFQNWCKQCSRLLKVKLRAELCHPRNPSMGYLGESNRQARGRSACVPTDAALVVCHGDATDMHNCVPADLLPTALRAFCENCTSPVGCSVG